MTLTDWKESLRLDKFDSRLGTLTSIRFDLSGKVQGVGMAENKGSSARTITLNLDSVLSLARPDGTKLVITNPGTFTTFTASAYDGIEDYSGTSGITTNIFSASALESFVSNDVNDFALFSATGGGFIDLELKAEGGSFAVGAGNMISKFITEAAGTAMVTYTYTPTTVDIPEPASLATMLAGLGLIGALRRRTGKKA